MDTNTSSRYRQGSLPNESLANYNCQVNSDCDMHFKNKIDEFTNSLSRGPAESLLNSQSKCENNQDTTLSRNLDASYTENTRKSSNSSDTSVIPTFPKQYDIKNGTSLSS